MDEGAKPAEKMRERRENRSASLVVVRVKREREDIGNFKSATGDDVGFYAPVKRVVQVLDLAAINKR